MIPGGPRGYALPLNSFWAAACKRVPPVAKKGLTDGADLQIDLQLPDGLSGLLRHVLAVFVIPQA